MGKVLFVLIDGLTADAAFRHMGFMEHLAEKQKAAKYRVKSELPSLSRPIYEVLMTGTPACKNGIVSNDTVRRSRKKNLFQLATKAGMVTAAAAYYFFCELYVSAPFNRQTDRFLSDPEAPIQHGIFYYDDFYPDSHVFSDADYLIGRYHPDFALIHPMNTDFIGHRYGGKSEEYIKAVANIDNILSTFLPGWIADGFDIIVTADHGMSERKLHGGNSADEREVPMYVLGENAVVKEETQTLFDQLSIAPMVCKMLGLTFDHESHPS
ncbi:alkaline phosphatase family protein [Caproicibacter sp.]|uniref:alkaline phosphatase family protein n=1 Tax=Caproicibacter sp. TaxID=2814884 RepID=UPI003989BDE0